MYPWPSGESNPIVEDALRIAMRYRIRAGEAADYVKVRERTAAIILTEWRKGVKHPIRLSNAAIVAVKNEKAADNMRAA
jgi:hypothetical protein